MRRVGATIRGPPLQIEHPTVGTIPRGYPSRARCSRKTMLAEKRNNKKIGSLSAPAICIWNQDRGLQTDRGGGGVGFSRWKGRACWIGLDYRDDGLSSRWVPGIDYCMNWAS